MIILKLVFVVVLLGSCSMRQDADDHKVFRYNESANITSLDPAFARNQANIWAVKQLFNGLVQLDNQLQVRPAIAHRWEVSGDGRTYYFLLRQDVYFHDSPCFPGGKGRRVVASDVVFSFQRILDPKTASPGAWIFRNILVEDGKPHIAAINDSTIRIRLNEPFPPFTGLLTMHYCSVIPHEAVTHFGKDFRRNPVGTGPFHFAQWKEGVKLVFLRNDNYFEKDSLGNSLPYLEAVAITFIADHQTEFLEFIKGNLDFISGIDASFKDELLTRSGSLNPRYTERLNMVTMPYLNTEYLAFQINPSFQNTGNNPLLIREVRQAINYGFDRRKMMRFLRNNVGTPGVYGFVPPGLPSFDSAAVRGYEYDPAMARALLTQAGFPEGRGLPEITLTTNAAYLDITRYIQFQLNELGFQIRIDVTPPATLREMVANAKVPFFRASWIADYPDAENYLALFYSGNFTPAGPNYTHFSNAEFDRLYRTAMLITDDSARFKLYQKMDQLVMNEAPVAVLYYDQVLRFSHRNIHGLEANALNLLNLKTVRKTANDYSTLAQID
ncbi:MAG TPA: ABC transporter substrate-binding protein [Bacteroidales bacterium]|nr:ABC transporter substrate-binding protein [Bacteroidales bacterium]